MLPPLAALRLVPLTPWHWRGAPAPFVADLSDAERELGWRPARSNVDALLDAYEHFLAARGAGGRGRPTAGRPLAAARLLARASPPLRCVVILPGPT